MTENIHQKNKFGRTTVLTLIVLYTCSIITFLFSLFCYFYLDISGIIFKTLLIYSGVNFLNILIFYTHKNIIPTYIISAFIAFVTVLIISFYSGTINSPAISFLVLLIFYGYLYSKFHGNLWLILVTLSVLSLYIVSISNHKVVNHISEENNSEFNLVFLLFLIILLGGVFGRLMNKTNEKIKKAKISIVQKNEEKAVMLKEIHHRVKNNLQVVNSLLRIQSRAIDDKNVKLMFKVAQSRIVAMARLHEKIYNTENLKQIDVNDHFKLLINDLIDSYSLEAKIDLKLLIEPVKMSIDTLLPLSLIVNELISNSLKHAFNGKDSGEVKVKLLNRHNSRYELIVGDNGTGISNGQFTEFVNSTGVRLIYTFVKQLNGDLKLLETSEGASFKVTFSEI